MRAWLGLLAVLVALVACQADPSDGVAETSTLSAVAISASRVAALGRLEPRLGVIQVAAPSPDAVIGRLLVEEGQRVEGGEVVAIIVGEELRAVQLARAEINVAHAERELQRLEKLQTAGAAPTVDLDRALHDRDVARTARSEARAEFELLRVRAPITGQVLAVHTRAGERAGEQGIVDLGDTSAMYAIAEVYETDIARIRLEQHATISSPVLSQPLQGVVEQIGLTIGQKDILTTDPVADADARVVEVKIRLEQPVSAATLTHLRVDVVLD